MIPILDFHDVMLSEQGVLSFGGTSRTRVLV